MALTKLYLNDDVKVIKQFIWQEICEGNTPQQAIKIIQQWPSTKPPEKRKYIEFDPKAFAQAANEILAKYKLPPQY